jgi:5-methylcytosine-specific restriction protein A
MSIQAVSQAFATYPSDSLTKLVLIRLADGCQQNGTFELDVDDVARFCVCAPDQVVSAIESLMETGVISRLSATTFSFLRAANAAAEQAQRSALNARPSRIPVPMKVRLLVYTRDNHACRSCGASADLSIDHVLPISKGGTNDLTNLQTLCRPCNVRKGAKV